MRIINGIKNLKLKKPTAVTVGIFDGVHRGHKKILKELKKRAKSLRGKSCVVTFDPHPAKVLHPHRKPPMLVSTKHKLDLLAAAGVNIAVLINFTKRFASISPARFVEEILACRLNAKELLVGKGFSFGSHRSGNINNLRKLGKKFGFDVHSISSLKSGKKVISSTLIRKLIMAGELREAKRLMGREVAILGTVTKGARRGRGLGYPTANLDPHHEAIPPSGVYIVEVKLKNKNYRGVLNIGFRPTFSGEDSAKEPTVEVNIFGLKRSIYGEYVEVIFVKRIRRERKFTHKDHLRARIKKDIEITKRHFRRHRL